MTFRTFLLFLVISVSIHAWAQQPVTLDECLAAAMKNQPLSGQNEIYKESSSLQQKNIDNGKLPQLKLTVRGLIRMK